MFIKLLWVVLSSLSVSAYLPDSGTGKQNNIPDILEGVGIEEKLEAQLPLDLTFNNELGQSVTLGSFFGQDKPVILSLVYYSCPSLCNLHLKGVFEVLKELRLQPGRDFEFVAVTIDAREDSDLAAAKKENYIGEFLAGLESPEKGIHFLTGTEENITALAKTVGFKYRWNEEAKEWAHASAAILNTPTGLISRYLHGVFFEPNTFRLSVVEASQGKIGSLADNFALFCFRYDPKANKYSFYIMNILRAVAGLVLLALLLWLVPHWLRARRASM